MVALKLNPVVEFVASYLCLILINYLGGFFHSKALIGWPFMNFILEESSDLFCLLMMLLNVILSLDQLIILLWPWSLIQIFS